MGDIRLQVQLMKIAFTMASRVHTGKFGDLRIIREITCCACVKQFNIQSPGSFHDSIIKLMEEIMNHLADSYQY